MDFRLRSRSLGRFGPGPLLRPDSSERRQGHAGAEKETNRQSKSTGVERLQLISCVWLQMQEMIADKGRMQALQSEAEPL